MVPQTILMCASLLLSLATAAPTTLGTRDSVHEDYTCVTEGGSSFWHGDVSKFCPAAAELGAGPEQVQVCCEQPKNSNEGRGNPCIRVVDGGCSGKSTVPSIGTTAAAAAVTPCSDESTEVTTTQTPAIVVANAFVKSPDTSVQPVTASSPAPIPKITPSTSAPGSGGTYLITGGAKTGTGYDTNEVFDAGGAATESKNCIFAEAGNDAAYGGGIYTGGDITTYGDDATHAACVTAPGTTALDGSFHAGPPDDGLYVAVSYCLMDRVPSRHINPAMTSMCNKKIKIHGG